MNRSEFKCSMCGQLFDPDQYLGCQACPLNPGCNLVCCPNCGYQTVDPRRSTIVRLSRLLSARKSSKSATSNHAFGLTLADAPLGCKVKVVGFSAGVPQDRRFYLQAYGLVVNYWVQVVQHKPVTIVRLDNIELALENDLARGILVQSSSDDQSNGAAS
jgi:hypothetical protein